MPDVVSLTIPADTAHVQLLRAAATAFAARMDFQLERITELHIAIDEVCSRLLAVSTAPRRLHVELERRDDALWLRAWADGKRRKDRELLSGWSRVILEAIAEDLSSSDSNGQAALSMKIPRSAG